jgi:hypothetical protein
LARPAWRNSGQPAFIEEQIRLNYWLKAQEDESHPSFQLLDTTGRPVSETLAEVARWVEQIVKGLPAPCAGRV